MSYMYLVVTRDHKGWRPEGATLCSGCQGGGCQDLPLKVQAVT